MICFERDSSALNWTMLRIVYDAADRSEDGGQGRGGDERNDGQEKQSSAGHNFFSQNPRSAASASRSGKYASAMGTVETVHRFVSEFTLESECRRAASGIADDTIRNTPSGVPLKNRSVSGSSR